MKFWLSTVPVFIGLGIVVLLFLLGAAVMDSVPVDLRP